MERNLVIMGIMRKNWGRGIIRWMPLSNALNDKEKNLQIKKRVVFFHFDYEGHTSCLEGLSVHKRSGFGALTRTTIS